MPKWVALALIVAAISLAGCNIEFGDGDFELGVPYRAQEQFNYCAPASVLMWRLYDGLPEVSQTTIFNWMGGTGCVNQITTRNAVNHFTRTLDAFWDRASPVDAEGLIARQITSMDRLTPVIAVINGNHTVVINGGKWHDEGDLYVWDRLIYHDPDPAFGRNFPVSADDWLDLLFCPESAFTCDQIISGNASKAWAFNLSSYGPRITSVGGGGYVPPDNQD